MSKLKVCEENEYPKSCHDCKYLVRQELTDTWLSIGEVDLYCDNENAVFDGLVETLDPDCTEDYPETCQCFEPKSTQ